ncbi:MAG: type IV pili methyl-accepting chemotaxis transducer N-terminal domain-containing protein [Pirellulales bacterium]|nr:type IV pili methyl-accepting chemotaxis transducer N-terminal domain-containing protein [Pirellulales bacterium]
MRRLSVRYLFVLLAVAVLIGADQAVIQPLLVRMNVFAPVVNLAGRQRMLSQRLAKAALAQAVDDAAAHAVRRTELRDSLAEWATAHDALRNGGVALDIPRIHSPAIDEAWMELQPHFDAMQDSAQQLVADSDSDDLLQAAVTALLEHEPPFLATMDRIVQLMQDQAADELRRLRALSLAIALTIVGLLVGLGGFVGRPATRAIRGQIDLLETRVTQRTRELDEALALLLHEILEREQAEARNRSLAAQLAHADRVESLGRLAAGLAHELNQPLGAIANYAAACDETLAAERDQVDRGRLQDYLRQMQQASLRAGAIVRRIRDFVQPSAGNLANVDVSALVAEVVDFCRPEIDCAEVELALELPTDEVATVTADPIQIQQVLVNLVQNALQAMSSAPPQRRRLAIRVAASNGAVQVDVIDHGPGLADADPEALFAPFHTTKADGLGIGLSICRSIVEQHQGTIWAKSLPLGGAQFSFVLPLAAEHALQPAC